MIKCPGCGTSNLETSRFCDECGMRLIAAHSGHSAPEPPAYVPPQAPEQFQRPFNVTSVGAPPFGIEHNGPSEPAPRPADIAGTAHATMTIERGDAPGTEFKLVNEESTIGRWDADNGVFPDIDLDAFDADAKVSRRHARIFRRNEAYFIEDLGSTNGTYINRGRRLLPGTAQALNDGDEVIVGKTFLRFHIVR